ncbi:hypothetical protein IMZ48_49045 [Candidatus Bathyarchaeota archaeon]|nr:hypothetical protein [Candidatus Bathyarchaeota archaeon]
MYRARISPALRRQPRRYWYLPVWPATAATAALQQRCSSPPPSIIPWSRIAHDGTFSQAIFSCAPRRISPTPQELLSNPITGRQQPPTHLPPSHAVSLVRIVSSSTSRHAFNDVPG